MWIRWPPGRAIRSASGWRKTSALYIILNTGLMLSSMKLEGLGWQPPKDLKQMSLDMMEDWKSI